MKKSIRSLLAIGMSILITSFSVAISLPVTVMADDTVYYMDKEYEVLTSGDFKYIAVGSEAVIMGFNNTTANVSIPSEINGLPVTVIGCEDVWGGKGAFQDNSSMQTVTIPESVKLIDENAFKNCSGLQQVLVGKGVKTIGNSAFEDCAYMQRIQFNGNTLTSIGNLAFADCVALDNLTLPESLETIGDKAFENCSALSYIKIPDKVTYLGGGSFCRCTALEEVVIGEGVTELPCVSGGGGGASYYENGTFEGCTNLLKVTFGSNIEKIGTDAFYEAGLLELNIPDSVITIDMGAFGKNKGLKTATLGKGVKTIGESAFESCSALETISLEDNVRSIGAKAFRFNSSLKEITIPSSVTYLGGGAFAACIYLEKAVIGHGVSELTPASGGLGGKEYYYDGTFEGCGNLKEVVLGDGLINIGVDAFTNTAIEKIIIPDSVITISDGAFYNCYKLKDANIGYGVTSIGANAFSNNTKLENISIGKGVVSIGKEALSGCTSLESLLIPSSVTSLGGALCNGNTSLNRVVIGNGVKELLCAGGVHGGLEYYYTGLFEQCTSLSDVSLGSGITKITTDTFADTRLYTLVLPSKVSIIENGAFHNSGLEHLYFTGSAPELGNKLFGNSSQPLFYKLANKLGYDNLGYTFTNFNPIKVSFDLNNPDVFAIIPTDQYLSHEGGFVIEPIEPMAEGYHFEGWYADKECTNKWNFLGNRIIDNTTLYAKWDKIEEVAPKRPKDLTDKGTTPNTITVSWSESAGATGYYVYVDGKKITDSAITATEYKITNLDNDTVFEINVVACNAKGESPMSLTKVIATQEVNFILGDCNYDGKINAQDALLVLKHSAKIQLLSDISAADVTKDGDVNASDALMILKKAANIIENF